MGARTYRISLGVGAALLLALQLVALGPGRGALWGLHFLAFVPVSVVAVYVVATLAGGGLLLGPLFDRPPRGRGPSQAWWIALAFAAFFALLAWTFRSHQTVLGDAWPLVTDLPQGQDFHPRQPLTLAWQQQVYQFVGSFSDLEGRDLARRSVALGNVFLGFWFALVSIFLGREILRAAGAEVGGRTALWASVVLVAQGYIVLFFGYLENYAMPLLCNALFLFLGLLALRRRAPVGPVLMVFVVALGTHLSSIVLLPAALFLLGHSLGDPSRRRGAVVDVALFAVAILLLDFWLRREQAGFSLWTALTDLRQVATQDQGGGAGIAYLFSGQHALDFFNEQILIGPFGAVGAVGAMVGFAVRRWFPAPAIFLALAASAFLGASFLTTEPLLGYARDWDLFAPAGIAFTALGLLGLARLVETPVSRVRVVMATAVLSALPTSLWVANNHHEPTAMARFETLPLGLGRTEVVMGNWHMRNGRRAEAEEWFQRALAINPHNANAYGLLANLYYNAGGKAAAAEAFGQALVTRPDKLPFRRGLVRCLLEMEEYEAAVEHVEWLVAKAPEDLGYAQALHEVYRRVGRREDAETQLARTLELFDAASAADPEDPQVLLDAGAMLANAGRLTEALARFEVALRLDPSSEAGLFNAGAAWWQLEQPVRAVPYLRRLLELYPDHPQAPRVRRWLDSHRGEP